MRIDSVHCRESAGTGPVNLKVVPNEYLLLPWHITVDQLICASLSHITHYWYEVGMLKVPMELTIDSASWCLQFHERVIVLIREGGNYESRYVDSMSKQPSSRVL